MANSTLTVTYVDHETIRINGTDHPTLIAEDILSQKGLDVDAVIEEAYTDSIALEC